MNKNKKNIYLPERQKGQITVIAVLFFISISTAIILGLTNPLVRHIAMATSIAISKEGFYAAEAGMEDMVYRLKTGLPVSSPKTLVIGEHLAVTTITDEYDGKKVVTVGNASDYIRKVETHLVLGTGASFFYGVQADVGGIIIENSASVEGNTYSNGTITSSVNGRIRGDVISAGPNGLLNGIYTTGSARAHTIDNSYIEKDAFYQTMTSSTVLGNTYPGSNDQPTTTLAISDKMIEEWKTEAAAGGTINPETCPYKIEDSTTIGPVVIECDLEIDGTNFTVTLGGPIWIKGNITTKNSPIIRISSSQQGRSLAIIADNPSDQTGRGKIILEISTTFEGAGNNSYILMISQNNSAEEEGDEVAINVQNSANGDLLVYAGHGEIMLQNSSNLKEVSGFRLRLKNNAVVVYETGLASLLFSSGPSGGFEISNWAEVE